MAGNNRIFAKIDNFGISSGQPDNIIDVVLFYYCSGGLSGSISGETTIQVDATMAESLINVALKTGLAAYADPIVFPTQGYTLEDVILIPARLTQSINNGVIRTIDSVPFTISPILAARANYSINVTWGVILNTFTGQAFLEYSTTGSGGPWILVNQCTRSQSSNLTSNGSDDLNLTGEIPNGVLVRIRSTATNCTVTYNLGQEVLY